jgi:hypothetical protein
MIPVVFVCYESTVDNYHGVQFWGEYAVDFAISSGANEFNINCVLVWAYDMTSCVVIRTHSS